MKTLKIKYNNNLWHMGLIFALFVFLTIGCKQTDNKHHSGNENKTEESDSNCLAKLLKFSNTLTLDTGKLLNFYFDDKVTGIKMCNLKVLRQNRQMQDAIVLIILKIFNNDRKAGFYGFYAQPIAAISKSASKIINEYGFLYYGKDEYFTESLRIDDVLYFVRKNPVFLKDPSINDQYKIALTWNVKKLKRFRY
ncbi:MAG TPA: hypothetical protein VGM63_21545 [Mucilaginibacter sp.]|jgi:hypothetical protein